MRAHWGRTLPRSIKPREKEKEAHLGNRRFEIILVVQASSSAAGHRAANAAWKAADQVNGCAVEQGLAQERLEDYSVADTGWRDWQDYSGLEVRVHYLDN